MVEPVRSDEQEGVAARIEGIHVETVIHDEVSGRVVVVDRHAVAHILALDILRQLDDLDVGDAGLGLHVEGEVAGIRRTDDERLEGGVARGRHHRGRSRDIIDRQGLDLHLTVGVRRRDLHAAVTLEVGDGLLEGVGCVSGVEGGIEGDIDDPFRREEGDLDALERVGGGHFETGVDLIGILVPFVDLDLLPLEADDRRRKDGRDRDGDDGLDLAAGQVDGLDTQGRDVRGPGRVLLQGILMDVLEVGDLADEDVLAGLGLVEADTLQAGFGEHDADDRRVVDAVEVGRDRIVHQFDARGCRTGVVRGRLDASGERERGQDGKRG